MEACQLNVPGDSRVLSSEHADVKVCVTGEDIFQTAVNNMELEMDVPDRIVVRGEGELVCQPVLYNTLQHGDIVAAGVEGIQVLAEVGFPLGAEGISIDAGTQVVQLHLRAVANVDAGDADGGIQQQEGDQHHGGYNKEAGVDGDVAPLVMEEACSPAAVYIPPVAFRQSAFWNVHGVSGRTLSCSFG